MISGFLEPVLYLLSIGVGVGALVGDLTLPGGEVVGYAAFVAPAMLASSAMTGALSETTFNFFGKMKFMRLYDGDAGHAGTADRDRARRAGLGDDPRHRSTRRRSWSSWS